MARGKTGKHWHELVTGLRTGKRGSERAVHKPLLTLMLLARAQRGKSNEVHFSEIAADLEGHLREFGPPRKSYHPEYPFWYLKNDGFWRVRDENKLEKRKGKDQPTRKELTRRDVVSYVPATLWSQLSGNEQEVRKLAQLVLDEFWPDTVHADIAAAVGLDMSKVVSKQKRDPRFRDNVMRAYERRCAVCGYDARLGDKLICIEAAHIKWKVEGGPDVVVNGVALCSLHHKLFDLGAIGLSEELRVQVSQDLTGQDVVRETVLRYKGQRMRFPQTEAHYPKMDFVHWHGRNVFRGPARV
jgi:putative restriction endonuclease